MFQDDVLISWVNPMYLQPDIVDDIRDSFEENSEIELKDFLLVGHGLYVLDHGFCFCLG